MFQHMVGHNLLKLIVMKGIRDPVKIMDYIRVMVRINIESNGIRLFFPGVANDKFVLLFQNICPFQKYSP